MIERSPRDCTAVELLLSPEVWIALLTRTAGEVVLGIDNIVFISILVTRLPKEQPTRGRLLGLSLAMVLRIGSRAHGRDSRRIHHRSCVR